MAPRPQPRHDDGGTSDRILRALLEWTAETGLRKLSMDEIASRAGVARATLYLHFPGKKALIGAAVELELGRFFSDLSDEAARHDDPRERIVRTFGFAYRRLRTHPAVQTVLRVNPQLILPYVTTEPLAFDLGRAFVGSTLDPDVLAEGVTVAEAGELIVRSIHSLILAPTNGFGLESDDGPERYAQRFLLPAILRE